MTSFLLVAILNINGEFLKLQELYDTQRECEARGEEIYRSHVQFFEAEEHVPELVIECWEITREHV